MAALPAIDLSLVAPAAALAFGAVAVLVVDLLLPRTAGRTLLYVVALAAIAISASYTSPQGGGARLGFTGAVGVDPFSTFLTAVFLVTAFLSVLMAAPQWQDAHTGGILALILWATTGLTLLAQAQNLLVLFLGLELLSLSLYVLCAVTGTAPAVEAGLKYFLLSSLASAFVLYGSALLQGATGGAGLADIRSFAAAGKADGLFLAGLALVMAAMAFKLALVPFHVWAPDVYQGAPTAVTAFMAVGTKAGIFAALARLALAVAPLGAAVLSPLWFLAGLSMIVGNLLAVPQEDLKRILAYSGVAHAGYLFAALPGATAAGTTTALFYLAVYAAMTLGAFAVLAFLSTSQRAETVDDLSGLAFRRPWAAAALTLFLLSLAGFPPTGGFVGKLALLGAALAGGRSDMVVGLLVGTAIGLYVYFRLILVMFR
ncbi:MAG: NADH-quinone oxidoreductase subunit N, partial [Clostridia bacterium]|nr:NADH-quinone oxidoreductase subunit N [Clostridia bacterium]